jgi:hypothetical protein
MSSKTVVRPVRSWCAPSGRVPPKSSGRHLAVAGALVRRLRLRTHVSSGAPCAGSACVPTQAPGVLGGTRAQLAHRALPAHQEHQELPAF